MKYRMPAEWESHVGTWIAWPHNQAHWPGKFEPIPGIYIEIVRALTASEPVFICVNDQATEENARDLLQGGKVALDQVVFHHIPTNASWSRDHGPTFVFNNNNLVVIDWCYNANGKKWGPYDLDDKVPARIAELLNLSVVSPAMILEGGSIDVNGAGTLLTTEQCLLNPNRNPDLSREQIEDNLKTYLGVTNILWLKEGIDGDDTDGHIDDIARFVDAHTVVCSVADDSNDIDFDVLRRNFNDLQAMRDQDGQPLRVISLPAPSPILYEDQRLPASYMNFYIANKTVLVPTFRQPRDAEVLDIFSELFSSRKIIGIDCIDLVWGFGTIHCSTQQQPLGNQ